MKLYLYSASQALEGVLKEIGNVQKYWHAIFKSEVGPSSKDDISKEMPPKTGSGLIFKGLCPEIKGEYIVIIWKDFIKPLKIRPPAINHIDIVLRR